MHHRSFATHVAVALGLACTPAGDDEDTAPTITTDSSSGDAPTTSGPTTTDSPSTSTNPDSTATAADSTGPGDGSTDTGHEPVGPGGCAGEGEPLTELEQMIADLPSDTWWTPADTKMRSACAPGVDPIHCANTIAAWSGGAWDPVHRQMLIFGGGHGDSADNTLYAFDLATLTWAALTDHSAPELMDSDPLPDGRPVSRHSYDGLQYLAGAERMFAWGGSQWQNGGITNLTWLYDHDGDWQDMGVEPTMSFTYGHSTAYDPVSDRVYMHYEYGIEVYDAAANTWSSVAEFGVPPYWPRYAVSGNYRGVFDSSRNIVWFIGGGLYLVYDLTADVHVTDEWITEGGGEFSNADVVAGHPEQEIVTGGAVVITANGPGVDYDATTDSMVAWSGGAPWRLDLASKTWSELSGSGAPAAAQESGGTFGRWRYIPRVNAFLLVNGVDEDVAFYKHSAACGPA